MKLIEVTRKRILKKFPKTEASYRFYLCLYIPLVRSEVEYVAHANQEGGQLWCNRIVPFEPIETRREAKLSCSDCRQIFGELREMCDAFEIEGGIVSFRVRDPSVMSVFAKSGDYELYLNVSGIQAALKFSQFFRAVEGLIEPYLSRVSL